MAKISKYRLSINLEGAKSFYEFDIMYASNTGFYAIIPELFNDQFDLLSDQELEKYHFKKIRKKTYNRGPYMRAAVATTESELKNQLKDSLKELSAILIKRRPVIVITYQDRSDNYHIRSYDAIFKAIGLNFSMDYCEESITGDSKANYSRSYQDEFLGKISMEKIAISVDSGDIVIDDTPENRLQLESIYNALKLLVEKLNNITKNDKSLIAFIESKQKLLN